jgi:hypothetical protein
MRTSVSCARSVEGLSGLGMAFSGGMLENPTKVDPCNFPYLPLRHGENLGIQNFF